MCNKPREELEEQLSIARNKCRKKEEEVSQQLLQLMIASLSCI